MDELEEFVEGELVEVLHTSDCTEGIIINIFPNLSTCELSRTGGSKKDAVIYPKLFNIKLSLLVKKETVKGVTL